VNHDKGDSKVYHQSERGKPRQKTERQQDRTRSFSKSHKREALRVADAERVGKFRRVIGEMNELVESMIKKHRQPQPKPDDKQSQTRERGIVSGRK